jgi:hypothetical protein
MILCLREYVKDVGNTALTDLGLFRFFIQYHAKEQYFAEVSFWSRSLGNKNERK